jgi:hypothetical protein
MTKEEFIKEFDLLPVDVRRRIEKIISDARKNGAEKTKKPAPKTPLSEHPFVGIWKDREDMKDGGAAWVRKLRREHWDRSHKWTNNR